jgi:hypothetical protein
MPRAQPPPDDSALRRFMVRLPDDLHHAIRVSAAFQRLTMEETIRKALLEVRWPGAESLRLERTAGAMQKTTGKGKPKAT